MRYRNNEGYADSTAGMAMRNVERQERKRRKYMSKTRSCRRNIEENKNHDKAVKLRKMTDEQLVKYIEDCKKQAIEEALSERKSDNAKYEIESFIEEVENYPGVGPATVSKLKMVARKRGFDVR